MQRGNAVQFPMCRWARALSSGGATSRRRRVYRVRRFHIAGRAAGKPDRRGAAGIIGSHGDERFRLGAARFQEAASHGPRPLTAARQFVTDTWSDYFDAVVVIRQEVAPTFDPWK